MKTRMWLVSLLLLLLAVGRIARALSPPPPSATSYRGPSLPLGGVLVKSGATVVTGFECFNAFGGNSFFTQLHATTTEPTTGAVPVWSAPVAANNTLATGTVPPGGIKVANVYLVCSSAPDSYSTCGGVNPAFWSVETR